MELAYKDLFNGDETILKLQECKKPVKLPSRIDVLEERVSKLENELELVNSDLDTCMEHCNL